MPIYFIYKQALLIRLYNALMFLFILNNLIVFNIIKNALLVLVTIIDIYKIINTKYKDKLSHDFKYFNFSLQNINFAI